jgi:hypothetical protein
MVVLIHIRTLYESAGPIIRPYCAVQPTSSVAALCSEVVYIRSALQLTIIVPGAALVFFDYSIQG